MQLRYWNEVTNLHRSQLLYTHGLLEPARNELLHSLNETYKARPVMTWPITRKHTTQETCQQTSSESFERAMNDTCGGHRHIWYRSTTISRAASAGHVPLVAAGSPLGDGDDGLDNGDLDGVEVEGVEEVLETMR